MNKKELIIDIELTRDSVCAGDDIDAPHKESININFIPEPIKLVSKISQKYLPIVNSQNHKWECKLNDKIVAVISKGRILPMVSEIHVLKKNNMHFKYYSSID